MTQTNNVSANAFPREDLDGLFAERQGAAGGNSLEIAPPIFTESLRSEWSHFDDLGFLETSGPDSPLQPKGHHGDPSRGGFSHGRATGNAKIYRYQDYTYSESEIREYAAAGIDDPGIIHARRSARFGVKHHAYTLGQFLSDANNYASANVDSAPADIGTASADLITDVEAILNSIVDAGVDIESYRMVAVYHDGTGQKLKKLDQVKDYNGFAGADVSGAATFRKTGFANARDVGTFWGEAFDVPITPMVMRGRVKTSGTAARLMNNDIAILAIPAPDANGDVDTDLGGFVRTQTISRELAIGRIVEYEPPKIPGRGFYVEQCYGLIRPDNAGYFGGLLDGVYS